MSQQDIETLARAAGLDPTKVRFIVEVAERRLREQSKKYW